MLADRVSGLLDDENALDKALAAFAQERYDALIAGYHETLLAARLSAPQHRIEMLREIAADPGRTEDFFTAMAGALPRRGAAR